jgi:hypothetical protein
MTAGSNNFELKPTSVSNLKNILELAIDHVKKYNK